MRSPLILLVLAALSVAGCGDKERENVENSRADGTNTDNNELLALRIREVRVDDRTPVGTAAAAPPGTNLRFEGPRERKEVAVQMARLQPGADWRTEQLSTAITDQLRKLLDAGPHGVVTPDAACGALRPDGPAQEDLIGSLTLRRWPREPSGTVSPGGPAGFARAFHDLRESLGPDRMEHSVKPVSIDAAGDDVSLRVRVELRGMTPTGVVRRQINSEWETRWRADTPPLLHELRVLDFEEIELAPDAPPLFADVTSTLFDKVPHYHAQILTGIDSWASRLTRLGDFSLTGHHGLSVGDVNNDGREDLFICDAGSLPNRLYLQEPDGTLRDVSAAAGVDWFEDSRSALLVDLDNDGDQDLVVATIAMIAFAENDGSGKFALRGGHPGAPYAYSLSAADFDNDGKLDLYACVYSANDSAAGRGFEASSPSPFHDARNGGRNLLLRNLGEFEFADVTARTGLDEDNTRWSFAAAWEDYDRDGDADLYVANDFGRNCLYRNDGGRFAQIADTAGVEDVASGMSVAWGDYNRDGHMDLYVGNMFSAAGNRVAYQRNFAGEGTDPVVKDLQRMARGNSLFRSDGKGGFHDVADTAAQLGLWAWSSGFADLNNDGWEDIVVANGYLTGRRPDDL